MISTTWSIILTQIPIAIAIVYAVIEVRKTKKELLDENEKIVTCDNEIAEICIAGPGVALGYWNDTETTRQVFIPSPEEQNKII